MLARMLRRRRMMMSLAGIAVGVILFAATGTLRAGATDDRSPLPVDRGLMQRIANFSLNDVTSGQSVSLYSFIGKRAIVLVFLGTDCPVGNLYVPRLIELNRAYREKGVIFLGINSNAHETSDKIAQFVKETGIDFPVLKDLQNKVSDTLLAERTCERSSLMVSPASAIEGPSTTSTRRAARTRRSPIMLMSGRLSMHCLRIGR